MKLEFNSVGELSEFLEFSKLLGGLLTEAKANVTMNVTVAPEPSPGELTTAILREMLDPVDAVSPVIAAEQGNESAPTEQPEQPKRKRRTKAEMEAARAVDQVPSDASETSSSNVETAEQAPTSANPFEANAASPTTQAILNAPNQQAATLAGIAAMQTQSPFEAQSAPAAESSTQETSATPAGPATPTTDAAGFIETRSLELLTSGADLTPIKHMHVCREFIAKHGQAKYLQGFTLAGLPATVGTYKAEQCARHQAALEFLNTN